MIRFDRILTWFERNSLQLLEPIITHLNSFFLLFFCDCKVSHFLCMTDDSLHSVRIESVEDVEEVWPIDLTRFGSSLRHKALELLIVFHESHHIINLQLIISWHVDNADIGSFEKLFLIFEDWSKEVFVDVADGRKVILHYSLVLENWEPLTVVS